MADVAPENVRFLWQGRIALGKLNIIAGDPGLGKSFLTLDVAARVSTGAEWPDGGAPACGDVVILTGKDGLADTVRPRLDAMGADVARIHAIKGVCRIGENGEDVFSLADDLPLLEDEVKRARALLVLIDPLNCYLQGVDTYRGADVRRVLTPLAAMADRTGCAVLVVQHLNKGEGNALYRPGGSVDFVAAARSVLGVAPDPDREGRRVVVSVKLNVAARPDGIGFRIDESGVVYDGEPVTMDATTAFSTTARDPEECTARDEARDFLTEFLSDGPVASTRVIGEARKAGIAEKTLRRAQKAMGVTARREGGLGADGAWSWRLPTTTAVSTIATMTGVPTDD
jgi:hypothetical protein